MTIKQLLATGITAASMAVAAIASQAEELRIGVEGAYPPFSEKTETGELVGFDIDIAHALCAQMERSCTLVEQDWDGIIAALQARKFDAIIASMSITEERQQVVDFTNKYYATPARFAARAEAFESDTPEALADARIGVQRGTTSDDYLSALYAESDILRYATLEEAYLDLQAERIDAVLADAIPLSEGFLKTDNGEGFAFFGEDHNDPAFRGEGIGIAIRKGDDDLRNALNAAIAEIRANGTYDAIVARYFDFDIYGG